MPVVGALETVEPGSDFATNIDPNWSRSRIPGVLPAPVSLGNRIRIENKIRIFLGDTPDFARMIPTRRIVSWLKK